MSNNIDPELNVIQNGHYGSDIRMAIHDAIEKLNKAAQAPHEETDTYTNLGIIGCAEFSSTIPEGIAFSLYEEGKTDAELDQMACEFLWRLHDGALQNKMALEVDASIWDENGDSVTGFCLDTVDSSGNPEDKLIGFSRTGCGVFYLRNPLTPHGTPSIFRGNFEVENNLWEVGYITNYGAMIQIRNLDEDPDKSFLSGIIIIGKTNNDDICWVGKAADGYRWHTALNAFVLHESETGDPFDNRDVRLSFMPDSAETYTNVSSGMTNQTMLMPVPTQNNEGKISYMQGIFAMPWSQFRGNQGIISLHGKQYVTNGYYALQI